MLEASSAPAAQFHQRIHQSLQSLLADYKHVDPSSARELAQKLRTVADELESKAEDASSHGAEPTNDTALHTSPEVASLERSWAFFPSRDTASGMSCVLNTRYRALSTVPPVV